MARGCEVNNLPPITAADIMPEWIAACREAMHVREGVPIRANPRQPSIDAYSINRRQWGPIMLPGGGFTFVDFDERNLVLGRLNDPRV